MSTIISVSRGASPVPLQAPVVIRNDSDPINDDLMRHLAADMGDVWRKVAITLNISRARIKAILRNTQVSDSTDEDARYQMLITWLKKMPKSIDKVKQQDNELISRDSFYLMKERVNKLTYPTLNIAWECCIQRMAISSICDGQSENQLNVDHVVQEDAKVYWQGKTAG